MKTNLFDCKVGDKVIYTRSDGHGMIKSFNGSNLTITWFHDNYTNDQKVNKTSYFLNEAWRHVFGPFRLWVEVFSFKYFVHAIVRHALYPEGFSPLRSVIPSH